MGRIGNFDRVFPADLIPGQFDRASVATALHRVRQRDANDAEAVLGRAGWYDRSAEKYELPTTPVGATKPIPPPQVEALHQVWIARFNPGQSCWADRGSDVEDESLFRWKNPEKALTDDDVWLSTFDTPSNREGIEGLQPGDLVVIQRSDPKDPKLRAGHGATSVLVGVAIVWSAEGWDDRHTGRREREVRLLPAARFRWPVSRVAAAKHRRMIGGSYKNMPQRQDGGGKLGFTLSAVPLDECSEILAVCGIHPDALAEPDLALLAARLRATALGDKELWRYRWDHIFINSIRVQNEQSAVGRCESWAEGKGLFFQGSAERTPNAGYDLLFADAVGVECQVEVKGYAASNLAQVHLQHSQFLRASESANGVPPDWRLFVVLSVDTPRPQEHVFTAQEVLNLVQKGRLQVRWPSVGKVAG